MRLIAIATLPSKIFQTIGICAALVVCAQSAEAAPAKAQKTAPKPASSSQVNPIYNSYVNQLRPKIEKTWNFPNGKNHVVLQVDVAQDGSVSNLVLNSTPKNGEAEQKASDAFNGAQPLPALPSGSTAKLEVTFDSQADQWDAKSSISVKMDPSKDTGSSASSPPAAAAEDKGDSSAAPASN